MSTINDFLKSGVVFTPAVVGYLIDGNRILLGIRKKVSLGLGENLVAGIGGKFEQDDKNPDNTLDREVYEEIGVEVLEKNDFGCVKFIFEHKPLDSKWNQSVDIYLITKWSGEPKETESIKPIWFNIKEIPWEKMWADNKIWLPKVLAGERINATFLHDSDNSVKEYRFE